MRIPAVAVAQEKEHTAAHSAELFQLHEEQKLSSSHSSGLPPSLPARTFSSTQRPKSVRVFVLKAPNLKSLRYGRIKGKCYYWKAGLLGIEWIWGKATHLINTEAPNLTLKV